MESNEFKGSGFEVGRQYGRKFRGKIVENVSILVKRNCIPPDPLPLDDPDFHKWVDDQENLIAEEWPWLIEEMRGAAEGSGCDYRDILFLNLRVWQYKYYGKPAEPSTACSSIVIRLADGTLANAGALDDDIQFYCGMVKVVPQNGNSYMSFPITGTSWGNRGMNSAGLCIGESSQLLPGLKKSGRAICQDLAVRVILQTCSTAAEVKAFCIKHPFTLNLLCSDRDGNVFCVHQTCAGLFEVSDRAPCALTNHVADDGIMFRLSQLGVTEFLESSTTRLRRGRLLGFARENNGKINADDVKKFIADRMAGDQSSICPACNIVLTYANPQAEPGIMWIAEPQATGNEAWAPHEIRT